jgi:hypothetical protein
MKCKRKLSIKGGFLTLYKNKLTNDFHISIALINFTTHKKTHFSHEISHIPKLITNKVNLIWRYHKTIKK